VRFDLIDPPINCWIGAQNQQFTLPLDFAGDLHRLGHGLLHKIVNLPRAKRTLLAAPTAQHHQHDGLLGGLGAQRDFLVFQSLQGEIWCRAPICGGSAAPAVVATIAILSDNRNPERMVRYDFILIGSLFWFAPNKFK